MTLKRIYIQKSTIHYGQGNYVSAPTATNYYYTNNTFPLTANPARNTDATEAMKQAEGEAGGDYRANILESTTPIQDIFQAFHTAKANGDLSNLYDIIIPNGYGSGIYNTYSEILTINGYDYKLRAHGYSKNVQESYYDIYQVGFGYLDRFSKYKPSALYNGGYYEGFFITGYDRQYFITIGANTSAGYKYLRKLFYSYE